MQEQVLFIETSKARYEICRNEHHLYENVISYRFSKVRDPFYKDNAYMSSVKRPMDEKHLDVIE